jgi:F-type H+-transporting ATPase subunit b
MLIDWFTVGAQTLNFFILVWLLKRFLYKPILAAIDAREQKIAQKMDDAKQQQQEAQQQRDQFQQKNDDFAQKRVELLKQMNQEVSAERERLLKEARTAAETLSENQQKALQHEYQLLNADISRLTSTEVFAITRKTLKDLADVSLEEKITTVFLQRLKSLDADAQKSLKDAFSTSSEPAQIRSAFELSSSQQETIQQQFNTLFTKAAPIKFHVDSALVNGIELSINGWKLAWSITEYLNSLEKSVAQRLNKQTPPQKAKTPETETETETETDTAVKAT